MSTKDCCHHRRRGTSVREFAASIGVRRGTLKRWVNEGLPVVRDWGTGEAPSVEIVPDAARAWIASRYPNTIARHRETLLYLARRDDGAIKIGFSSNVRRRVVEIGKLIRRYGTGTKVRLLATRVGDKPAELALHARFSEHALGAEWFRPAPEILALVEEWGAIPDTG